MGYYTQYKVDIVDMLKRGAEYVDEDIVNNALKELVGGYSISVGIYTDTIKWYDNHDHMTKLSMMFPNTLFSIEGNGEEQGDMWKTYYCNGNHIEGRIKMEYQWPEDFTPESFFDSYRKVKKYEISSEEAKAAKALLDKYNAERGYK